jgi:hypothetical protein
MAYVKCKIHEEGYEPYQVEALIDTTSHYNFISKKLVDKLGITYTESSKVKYLPEAISKKVLGYVECLDLSFQYN